MQTLFSLEGVAVFPPPSKGHRNPEMKLAVSILWLVEICGRSGRSGCWENSWAPSQELPLLLWGSASLNMQPTGKQGRGEMRASKTLVLWIQTQMPILRALIRLKESRACLRLEEGRIPQRGRKFSWLSFFPQEFNAPFPSEWPEQSA